VDTFQAVIAAGQAFLHVLHLANASLSIMWVRENQNVRILAELYNDSAQSSYQPTFRVPIILAKQRLSVSSRRSKMVALHSLAGLLSDGEATAFTLNWAALRSEHITALCCRLAERYAVATANRMLSALGGVLLEAYLLGQIAADDYHCAINIMSICGQTSPSRDVRATNDGGAHAPGPAGARQRA
jgi:hypothetical protein